MKNYSKICKNATEIKTMARFDLMEVIRKALEAEYGVENVGLVGSNEYGVVVGSVTDSNGFEVDLVETTKPTVKEWESRTTAKKRFKKYDLEEAVNAYQMNLKAKARDKEEKKRLKAEKIERDKKTREAKKEAETETD